VGIFYSANRKKFIYSVMRRHWTSQDKAEDIVQGAFLRALENLHKFSSDSLNSIDEDFAKWFHTLLRNYSITVLSSASERREKTAKEEIGGEESLLDFTKYNNNLTTNFSDLIITLELIIRTSGLSSFEKSVMLCIVETRADNHAVAKLLGCSLRSVEQARYKSIKKVEKNPSYRDLT